MGDVAGLYKRRPDRPLRRAQGELRSTTNMHGHPVLTGDFFRPRSSLVEIVV